MFIKRKKQAVNSDLTNHDNYKSIFFTFKFLKHKKTPRIIKEKNNNCKCIDNNVIKKEIGEIEA